MNARRGIRRGGPTIRSVAHRIARALVRGGDPQRERDASIRDPRRPSSRPVVRLSYTRAQKRVDRRHDPHARRWGSAPRPSVFSVVSTLLIHRLPYPHADRVTVVTQQPTGGNNTGMSVSIMPQASAIRGWQRDARSFESIQAMSIVPRSLRTASGDDSRASTAGITPGFFDFAEVRPIRGRIFTPSEVAIDSRVALLSEGFWRARLGADPLARQAHHAIGYVVHRDRRHARDVQGDCSRADGHRCPASVESEHQRRPRFRRRWPGCEPARARSSRSTSSIRFSLASRASPAARRSRSRPSSRSPRRVCRFAIRCSC